MTRWTNVRWSEAAQVAQALGWPTLPDSDARMAPEIYAERLRRDGRLVEAVQFMGQALPRFEGVAWAVRLVRDLPRTTSAGDAARSALRSALLWLQDPSEHRRRQARSAAEAVQDGGPERLAAMAVFYSGGSLSPGDGQPVPAPKTVSGRLAAGAVLVAAAQCASMPEALQIALDEGDRVAAGAGQALLA
jgi:hypothetical protein